MKIFANAMKNWQFVLKFIIISLIFWGFQFAYQYFVLVPEEIMSGTQQHTLLEVSLIRSFAFAGTVFIGLSFLSSTIFKFRPKLTKYWAIRRSLGVMGFTFIFFHALSVIQFYFMGSLSPIWQSFGLLMNPRLLGTIGLLIFFPLFLTSTDWAVAKMGPRRWKTLQRFGYFAYLFSVFHYLLANPSALLNLAGYSLLAVTAFVLIGQLYLWFKVSRLKGFKTTGTLVGLILILLYLIFTYLVYL